MKFKFGKEEQRSWTPSFTKKPNQALELDWAKPCRF